MSVPGKNSVEMEGALAELNSAVSALQRHYELYFLGLERREPSQDRDDLKRQLMALKRQHMQNTALKFRLNSLWSKFLSYERMWVRTATEIEEGRYHRDVYKAKMRARSKQETDELNHAQKKGMEAAASLAAMGDDPDDPNKASKVPSKAATQAAKARKAQGTKAKSGLTEDKLERLYSAFVTAKKRCKEDTKGISLDAMRRSLDKQIPVIKKKHGANSVDFKVVIKGGKAILKAVPH